MKEHSKPSDALLGELREVAAASAALAEQLRGDNTIPSTFPKKLLLAVAESLTTLPETTTASAAILLEYASRRLPAIRREHVRHHEHKPAPSEDAPEITRGASLDQHLKNVIAAVGTALDECRREAALVPEDEEDEPLDHRVDPNSDPEAARLLNKSADLDRSATHVVDELHQVKQPSSKRADDLERSVKGMRTVNSAAAAELQMSGTVVPWLKRLGRGISNYPPVIKGVGKLLERGGDIAGPAWDRWERVWHKWGAVAIEEATGLGRDIQKVAEKWETESAFPREDLPRADDNLAEFRMLLNLSHDESWQVRLVALQQLVNRFPEQPAIAQRLKDLVVNDKDSSWARRSIIDLCTELTNDASIGSLLRDLYEKSSVNASSAGDLLDGAVAFKANREDQAFVRKLRDRVTAPRGVPLDHKRRILRNVGTIARDDADVRRYLMTLVQGSNQRLSINAIIYGAASIAFRPDVQEALFQVAARSEKHNGAVVSAITRALRDIVEDDGATRQLVHRLEQLHRDPRRSKLAEELLARVVDTKARFSKRDERN